MNAIELERELWKIHNELLKAGIKSDEYPSIPDAVAELVRLYNVEKMQEFCEKRWIQLAIVLNLHGDSKRTL